MFRLKKRKDSYYTIKLNNKRIPVDINFNKISTRDVLKISEAWRIVDSLNDYIYDWNNLRGGPFSNLKLGGTKFNKKKYKQAKKEHIKIIKDLLNDVKY